LHFLTEATMGNKQIDSLGSENTLEAFMPKQRSETAELLFSSMQPKRRSADVPLAALTSPTIRLSPYSQAAWGCGYGCGFFCKF